MLLRGADGKKNVRVTKLLCEVSLTDVYLDFQKAHPEVKIGERAFRSLQPPEMRRMTARARCSSWLHSSGGYVAGSAVRLWPEVAGPRSAR